MSIEVTERITIEADTLTEHCAAWGCLMEAIIELVESTEPPPQVLAKTEAALQVATETIDALLKEAQEACDG